MKATSIVLADDHPVVRRGLRAMLEAEPNFCIVGEAGNGLESVRLVEHLKPDVLVLDLMMPQLNGLGVLQQVVKHCPATHVIILSMHQDESYVLRTLHYGATAYVLKDACCAELVQAVRVASEGHRYLSAPFSERAIEVYAQRAKDTLLDSYETLSNREREVLQLSAEGFNTTEIAKRLFISSRTAETHRAKLMHKLGLQSQTDVIRYALRQGIISLENR